MSVQKAMYTHKLLLHRWLLFGGASFLGEDGTVLFKCVMLRGYGHSALYTWFQLINSGVMTCPLVSHYGTLRNVMLQAWLPL